MAFILRCLTCGQAAEDGKKSCFQIDVKDKEGKWVRAEAKRWSSETGHVNRLSISFVGFDRKWDILLNEVDDKHRIASPGRYSNRRRHWLTRKVINTRVFAQGDTVMVRPLADVRDFQEATSSRRSFMKRGSASVRFRIHGKGKNDWVPAEVVKIDGNQVQTERWIDIHGKIQPVRVWYHVKKRKEIKAISLPELEKVNYAKTSGRLSAVSATSEREEQHLEPVDLTHSKKRESAASRSRGSTTGTETGTSKVVTNTTHVRPDVGLHPNDVERAAGPGWEKGLLTLKNDDDVFTCIKITRSDGKAIGFAHLGVGASWSPTLPLPSRRTKARDKHKTRYEIIAIQPSGLRWAMSIDIYNRQKHGTEVLISDIGASGVLLAPVSPPASFKRVSHNRTSTWERTSLKVGSGVISPYIPSRGSVAPNSAKRHDPITKI
ncbi:hypothetical protein AAMO2058_001479400 [Amorphochlora amoebiformis]